MTTQVSTFQDMDFDGLLWQIFKSQKMAAKHTAVSLRIEESTFCRSINKLNNSRSDHDLTWVECYLLSELSCLVILH